MHEAKMLLSTQFLMFEIVKASTDIKILAYNRLKDDAVAIPAPGYELLARANYYSILNPAPENTYANSGSKFYPDTGFHISIDNREYLTLQTGLEALKDQVVNAYYEAYKRDVTPPTVNLSGVLLRGNIAYEPMTAADGTRTYASEGNFLMLK